MCRSVKSHLTSRMSNRAINERAYSEACEPQKICGICLKRLRSRDTREKANCYLIWLTCGQLSPLDAQRSARGCPAIANNIQPYPKRCLLMQLARVGARTATTRGLQLANFSTRIGVLRKICSICAEGLRFSAFHKTCNSTTSCFLCSNSRSF